MNEKIFVVEDEPAIADTITYALDMDGFKSTWVQTGAEASELLKKEIPSLIILDIGLPDISGFELFRQIRAISKVPVIFLTARSDEIDRVAGLEMGGDDYITKPFSPRELTARVRAVLRRASTSAQESSSPTQCIKSKTAGFFNIDEQAKKIHFHKCELELSRYEYLMLHLFIKNPGRVYSREEIMEQVWEEPEFSTDRTVDTHVKRIRQKLKQVDASCELIETRRGLGYSYRGCNE